MKNEKDSWHRKVTEQEDTKDFVYWNFEVKHLPIVSSAIKFFLSVNIGMCMCLLAYVYAHVCQRSTSGSFFWCHQPCLLRQFLIGTWYFWFSVSDWPVSFRDSFVSTSSVLRLQMCAHAPDACKVPSNLAQALLLVSKPFTESSPQLLIYGFMCFTNDRSFADGEPYILLNLAFYSFMFLTHILINGIPFLFQKCPNLGDKRY